eukprot:g42652.t1
MFVLRRGDFWWCGPLALTAAVLSVCSMATRPCTWPCATVTSPPQRCWLRAATSPQKQDQWQGQTMRFREPWQQQQRRVMNNVQGGA